MWCFCWNCWNKNSRSGILAAMFLSWNCTWLETSDWNCFSRNSDKRSRKVTKTNLDDDNVQIFSEYFYFDIKQSCLFLPFVLSLAVPDDWNMFLLFICLSATFPEETKKIATYVFASLHWSFLTLQTKSFLLFWLFQVIADYLFRTFLIVPRF